ncbi:MAG: hypothetical protein EON58_21075 [Alphaproteobacteria bacterium]|nr:MAG: hypothetical protein EON58_21075 [Alphaproteobacteria bacterium]
MAQSDKADKASKAKGRRDKTSPFGEWMEEVAVSKGTSVQEIARYINQEYTFVSRLYDGTKNPTYDIAMQIGEMVEDVVGALTAAGYSLIESEAKESVVSVPVPGSTIRRMLASGDELTVNPDDPNPDETARRTEAFLLELRKLKP